MKEELRKINWTEELRDLPPNAAWENIKDHVSAAITKTTPKTSMNSRRGKKWMDRETLASVRKKHKLFRKWQISRQMEDYEAYIKARNQARKACRKAQRKQEAQVAAEAKSNHKANLN